MANKKHKEHAWDSAKKVRGKNQDLYRRDDAGKIMYKPSYGKQSEMGWEVDHKKPKSKGGSESLQNIQALNWETNRTKSDSYPKKKK